MVTLTGELPQVACLAEVARSHVGLCLLDEIPNFTSSLAIKIFEHMRYGLPVAASDFPCWREFATDLGAGIQVDIHRREAIADAVERLLAHPEDMAAMGRRGREAVETVYSWEIEQRRLWAFYRRLLESRGAVAPAK